MIPRSVRSRLGPLLTTALHGSILLVVRTLIVDWPRPALLALMHLLAISAAARIAARTRSFVPIPSTTLPTSTLATPDRARLVWLLAAAVSLALVLTYWSLALASLASVHFLLVCVGVPIAHVLSSFIGDAGRRPPMAFATLDGWISLALMWPAALLFTFRDILAFDGNVPVVCGAVLACASVRVLSLYMLDGSSNFSSNDLVQVVAPRSAVLALPLFLFVELPLLWSRSIQSLAETSSAHTFPALWVWLVLSTVLAGVSVLSASKSSSLIVFPIHPTPTSMLAIGGSLTLVHMDLIATNIKIAQADFRVMFVTLPIVVLGMAMYEQHVVQGGRRLRRHDGKRVSGEALPISAADEHGYEQLDLATRQAFKQSTSQAVLPSPHAHAHDQFTLTNSDSDEDLDSSVPAPNSTFSPTPPATGPTCSTTASILAFLTALIALLLLPATLFKSLTPPTPTCPAPYTPTTIRRISQPTIPRLLPPTLPATWPGQSEPVAHLLYKLTHATASQYSWDYRTSQPNPHAHRVLVLHADDRPLVSLASQGGNAWALPHATIGPLYGAWWAVRHGYDYRRVGLDQGHTPQGGWGKPKVVYDALVRGYDVVVMFDSDAYVQMPEVGVEEMMDRWGMKGASLLLALDPGYQPRANENATNTGFWIVRNTPVARRVMRELAACPESIECRKWWTTWPAEQAAFTKLVRSKMKEGDELIVAPCDEANGWWEFGACQGRVVTHAWSGKHLVTANMIERMVEWWVEVLEKLVRGDHYHFQDSCVPWRSGSEEGERCKFLEDDDKKS